jgi:hypothetical protein
MVVGHGIGADADIDWSGIAKGAAQGAATAIITRIGANGQPEQVVVPVKEEGIPKPILYIGGGILALVLVKMLTGKRGGARPALANPSRRRRRRRRGRRRGRR